MTMIAANTEQARISSTGVFSFNSGYGSAATAYGCRAWVNFNGTGTVAIRGSGNVSSITDNGTGDYTVNFTTAMVDANYSPIMCGQQSATVGTDGFVGLKGSTIQQTTSSVRVASASGVATGALVDFTLVSVAVFR
jgi:hypothetical protein